MTTPPPAPATAPVSVVTRLSVAELDLLCDALAKFAIVAPNRIPEIVRLGLTHPELSLLFPMEEA